MRRTNIIVSVVTVLIAAAAVVFWFAKGDNQPNGYTGFADADIVAGATLYAQNCAVCHGDQLQGQSNWRIALDDGTFPAPPHDQTGHTWHHDDALLFSYTKLGGAGALAAQGVTSFKSAMPGFGETLSDQDIRNVLGFIASTWPERVRKARKDRAAGGS